MKGLKCLWQQLIIIFFTDEFSAYFLDQAIDQAIILYST